jgi:hypothetical protein
LIELNLVLSYWLTNSVEYDESGTRRSLIYGSNKELLQLALVQVALRIVHDLLLGHWLRLRAVRGDVLCRHAERSACCF